MRRGEGAWTLLGAPELASIAALGQGFLCNAHRRVGSWPTARYSAAHAPAAGVEMKMVAVQRIVVGRQHDAEKTAGAVAHRVQERPVSAGVAPISRDAD